MQIVTDKKDLSQSVKLSPADVAAIARTVDIMNRVGAHFAMPRLINDAENLQLWASTALEGASSTRAQIEARRQRNAADPNAKLTGAGVDDDPLAGGIQK